jgi:hypothetical protein
VRTALFKSVAERPAPNSARIHAELKKEGVTKQLLWQEYLETHPSGYQRWTCPPCRFLPRMPSCKPSQGGAYSP